MTTKSRARRSAEKYADELIELIRRGFPEAEFELYRAVTSFVKHQSIVQRTFCSSRASTSTCSRSGAG